MSEEEKLKPLSKRHQRVLDEYLICWSKTEAYKKAYPSASHASAKTSSARLFADDNFSAHLQARLDEVHMGSDEALALLSEIGHADIGVFYKVVETWMFNPLPTYEVLGEREVIDEESVPPRKRTSYLVRNVVLDMDKVIDPRYSHLIQEFSDSRRTGLKIKIYDKHAAIRDVLKVHGQFKEQVDITSGGKPLEPKIDDERFNRAISTLADALRERIPGTGAKPDSEVGAPE